MAEMISGSKILHMKPPGGKPYDRNHQLPAMLVVFRDMLPAAALCARARAAHINDLVIEHTDYVVVDTIKIQI